MQVCESTEVTYDKNVVNFSGKDKQCARRLQEVCTKYPFIYAGTDSSNRACSATSRRMKTGTTREEIEQKIALTDVW